MRCRSCTTRLVPSRAQPVPRGYRHHAGRGLCRICYHRERRAGRLDRWPPLPRSAYVWPTLPPSAYGPPRSYYRCTDGDCPICQDTRWLADTGTPAAEWPARLGTTIAALSKRLYRHGQTDLYRRLERIHTQQRALAKVA